MLPGDWSHGTGNSRALMPAPFLAISAGLICKESNAAALFPERSQVSLDNLGNSSRRRAGISILRGAGRNHDEERT